MAFMTLNGVTLPVSIKDTTMTRVPQGDSGRSASGKLLETRQFEPRVWTGRTAPVSQDAADAWEGMLWGRGHHFSFDTDRYSDLKGLEPSSGATDGTITVSGQHGSYIALTAAHQVIWPTANLNVAATVGAYTILCFEGAGVWDHYAIVRLPDGTVRKWVDGVRNDGASTPFVSLDGSGDLYIGDLSATWEIDDLVYMPFAIPDDWAPTIYTEHSARAWANNPEIRLNGDFVRDEYTTVEGKNIQSKVIGHPTSGAWDASGQMVSFELHEV